MFTAYFQAFMYFSNKNYLQMQKNMVKYTKKDSAL